MSACFAYGADMKTPIQTLHEKAIELAKTYLRAEAELVSVLQEIDVQKAYEPLGFRSLYEYARLALHLSEAVAYNLITVARKSVEVPALKQELLAQTISLSNARMITPVITPENQEKWISAAQNLSKRQLEKEIAKFRPDLSMPDRARYVAEDKVRVEITISEELYETLIYVQDLVSTKTGKHADLETAIKEATILYLERNDPVRKAARAEINRNKRVSAKPVPGQVSRSPGTVTAVKHVVAKRDAGQCTFTSKKGRRCTERRWLDIHHIQPRSSGGSDYQENLTTLCRAHHRMIHRWGSNLQSSNFSSRATSDDNSPRTDAPRRVRE